MKIGQRGGLCAVCCCFFATALDDDHLMTTQKRVLDYSYSLSRFRSLSCIAATLSHGHHRIAFFTSLAADHTRLRPAAIY